MLPIGDGDNRASRQDNIMSLAMKNHLANLILKCGANQSDGEPLREAMRKGGLRYVEDILQYSKMNNVHHSAFLKTFLSVALSEYGQIPEDDDIVLKILEYGYPIADEVFNGRLFYTAIAKGCYLVVEELLKHGADVHRLWFEGSTFSVPLEIACQYRRAYVARILIRYGAFLPVMEGLEDGRNQIWYVRPAEDYELRFDCNVKKNDDKDVTVFEKIHTLEKECEDYKFYALKESIDKAQMDIIKLLLLYRTNINRRGVQNTSPLHWAIFRHHNTSKGVPLMELLLKNGAYVNAQTNDDIAVIHVAALLKPKNRDILRVLLDFYADVNICCKTITPLHLACLRHNTRFCEMLLNNGAKVNVPLNDGKTALHVVVSESSSSFDKFAASLETCPDLQTLHNDVFVQCNGRDPSSCMEVIDALIKGGANVNCKDDCGKTPLHCAAENSSWGHKVLATLVHHGADVISRDKFNRTPLHCAVESCDKLNGCCNIIVVIHNLVYLGADINCKDLDGCTPLHTLVQKPEKDFSHLLDLGSDINALNNANLTPLEVALKTEKSWASQKSRRSADVLACLRKNILALQKHIIKLKAASLFVHPRNSRALGGFWDSDYYNKCKREVNRMKKDKVGSSNISYYTILTCSRNQLMMLANQDSVVQALQDDEFGEKFPTYAPEFELIKLAFTLAPRRQRILDLSKPVFCRFVADLPDLCVDLIFGHLSDGDLEAVARAFSPEFATDIPNSTCTLGDHERWDLYVWHKCDYETSDDSDSESFD